MPRPRTKARVFFLFHRRVALRGRHRLRLAVRKPPFQAHIHFLLLKLFFFHLGISQDTGVALALFPEFVKVKVHPLDREFIGIRISKAVDIQERILILVLKVIWIGDVLAPVRGLVVRL